MPGVHDSRSRSAQETPHGTGGAFTAGPSGTTGYHFAARRTSAMKRRLVGCAAALAAFVVVAGPAHAQRRTTLGFAAGATVPVGDLGDGTSTGFHALGTLAISGTATSPLGFRVDGMYNNLSGKSSGPDVTMWTVNGNLVYA